MMNNNVVSAKGNISLSEDQVFRLIATGELEGYVQYDSQFEYPGPSLASNTVLIFQQNTTGKLFAFYFNSKRGENGEYVYKSNELVEVQRFVEKVMIPYNKISYVEVSKFNKE